MLRLLAAQLLVALCACLWMPATPSAGEPDSAQEPDATSTRPDLAESLANAYADSADHVVSIMRTGRFSEAEPIARRMLRSAEELLGASSREADRLRNLVVRCLWRTGKSQAPETIALAQEATAIAEEAFGPEDLAVASHLFNLGVIRTMGGDFKSAGRFFERVLAIREPKLPPDHHEVVSIIGALGNVRAYATDYAGALPMYERALSLVEDARGETDPQAFNMRGNVASTLKELGRMSEARALLRKQIDLLEGEGLEIEDLGYAYSLLAGLYFDLGDYAESLPLRKRSLEVREAVHPEGHPRIAEALLNYGSTLWKLGRYEEAWDRMERARTIWENAYGADHPHLGSMLAGLGRVAFDMGDLDQARTLFERVVTLREAGFGAEAPNVADGHHSLAQVAAAQGRVDEARDHLLRALRIVTEGIGPDHPLTGMYAGTLARVDVQAGDLAEAARWALESERVLQRNLRLTLRALPERQALRYARGRTGGVDVLLTLLDLESRVDPALTRQAWDAVVRARAVVLDEIAARNRQRVREGNKDTRRLIRDLQEASTDLANLYVRGPGDSDAETYRGRLENARRAMEAAELALIEAGEAESEPDVQGLEAALASLPTHSGLVAYVLHERFAPGQPATDPGILSYHAFCFTGRGGAVQSVELGPAAEIDAAIAAWKQEVTLGALRTDRPAGESLAAYRAAGEALRAALWDPISGLVEDIDQLFVVPDGQIHLVNLATLPNAGTGYLADDAIALHYLSAERELLLADAAPEGTGGALVCGAPDFDGGLTPASQAMAAEAADAEAAFRGERAECSQMDALRFAPLPECLREAREVAELWRVFPSEARLLTGAQATESQVKSLTPGCRLLHVATHGFFLSGDCPSGFAGTRGIGLLVVEGGPSQGIETGAEPGAEPLTPPAEVQNPLLLSGLALAGANRRDEAAPGQDDGILTAQEIAALDLSSVRWAVLSACETGSGEVLNGEGVFGLQRAFRLAGARTLVTSLWSVRDDDARRWMHIFYESILRKQTPTSQAVRAATRALLEERRARGESTHPFHWGAFVATGDWR